MNREPRAARKSRWQRLRPFVRRDLRSRLVSAAIAVAVLFGLSWLAVSAFTRMDSAGAHALRVEMGLEAPYSLCGGVEQPLCSYDDREQELVDEAFERDRRVRMAILHELDLRIEDALLRLDKAEALINSGRIDFNSINYDTPDELEALLAQPDLRPLDDYGASNLVDAGDYDPILDVSPLATKSRLLAAIDARRDTLTLHAFHVSQQRAREVDSAPLTLTVDRAALLTEMQAAADFNQRDRTYQWLLNGRTTEASRMASTVIRHDAPEFGTALRPEAAVWGSGWELNATSMHTKPSVRYHSMVEGSVSRQMLGALFLALASFMLLVVAPVITATATAREREAGTLPVLRMTGMSAGDLAMAMVFGPNVFAYGVGAALLLLGSLMVVSTVGITALAIPVLLLVVLAMTTSLTAIGLGDALGQRVNAMIVGGGLGLLLVGPGLLGTALSSFNVASTGLLLGPLPAVLSGNLALAGIPGVGLSMEAELATTMIGYSVFVQVLLGLMCLHSWRRRVERGWAPLFRPVEGVVLAIASIGCSALSLLDISSRANAQDFDALNVLTALSSSFLLPVLGWLLVSSLRRPARARSVASHVEARRAFLRFQGVIALTVAFVGAAYWLVMRNSGLVHGESEVMWATLAQVLLVAETAVGTLLWASRRREGKLRAGFLGGALVVLQLGMTAVVYGLEVGHVARTNEAAMPLLLTSDVSPYWMAFLAVLWAAGIALLVVSLMRNREDQADEAKDDDDDDDDEVGDRNSRDGMPGRRLIH